MSNTDTAKHIDSLKSLAKLFKQKSIFGHRLTYISNHDPFEFFATDNRDQYWIDAFSPTVAVDDSNSELFSTEFYKDMYACQGHNFFLGFDNGEYLYVDCWADNHLTLWTTTDSSDAPFTGGYFKLDRFFDDIMGKPLVDVEFLVSDEFPNYPDEGGDVYDNGDYSFFGRLKLIFADNKSLLFACNLGMPRITSFTCDNMDKCSYWHIASCNSLRDINIMGQDPDDIKELLESLFDKDYVDSIMTKVHGLNDYQLQNVWSRLCIYNDEPVTKNDVNNLVDYYIKYPHYDSRDKEIMSNYAKYICDKLNRRDVLDEDYILSRLNSIDKLQMLMDRLSKRNHGLQAEAIMEDIDLVKKYYR